MALRLYNTLTRQIAPLDPIQAPKVSMYVCGMTPSFHPHLGHARTFITFDVLYRYLRAKGYEVTYARNITDIDDRIIDRAKVDGIPWDAVVARYLLEFEECAQKLGLLTPDLSPRATEEMPYIVAFIQRLVELEYAYETGDGVYFTVEKDPSYGELSRRNVDELRAGERIAVREEKRDPLDFALWKKAKPGEPTWESPWGPGRPGWHIECSAMCRRYLGDQFDIHGGATDLVFPHHENEVAQTESATGKIPMARVWVHAGLLQVDGQKMSKSLGNFIPLAEFLRQQPPAAVRYLFYQTGYRKPSNFTPAALEAAAKGLRGLYADLDALRAAGATVAGATVVGGTVVGGDCQVAPSAPSEFEAYLDDDLNTSGAIGWLQRKVQDERALRVVGGDCQVAPSNSESAQATVALAERCLELLGLPRTAAEAGFVQEGRSELSAEQRASLRAIAGDGALDDKTLIDQVVALRTEARANKDFAASDRLRKALAGAGIVVRDSKADSEWSFDDAR